MPTKPKKPRRVVQLQGNSPLLNFYMREMAIQHPISGADVMWQSVEHYFQACKAIYIRVGPDQAFAQFHDMEEIRHAPNPREAKRLGRALDMSLTMWNKASLAYMIQAHIAKFSQHADLRHMLLETGTKKLVEHRPDPIWGDNMDGSGKNLCGRSLMIVRRMAKDWRDQ